MDKPSHNFDAVQNVSTGRPTDSGLALHADANFGAVGDHSASQAWSNMARGGSGSGSGSGASAGGDNVVASGSGHQASDYGSGSGSSAVDFAAHADIYAGHQPGDHGGASAGNSADAVTSGDGGMATPGSTAGAIDFSQHSDIYTGASAGSDGRGDRVQQTDSSVSSGRAPQLDLPLPEAIAHAPLAELHNMVANTRHTLSDYVQSQGAMPDLALHGTTATSGQSLTNFANNKGEIFVAGPDPSRKSMGADQYVGDLGTSARTSIAYTEKHTGRDGVGGPFMVYDASSQPQAWSKNTTTLSGGGIDGGNSGDQTHYGMLDLSQAKRLGSVSRQDLDDLKNQFQPLNDALLAKQADMIAAPGGVTEADKADILSRAKVINDFNRLHEARAVLNVHALAKAQQ